MRILVRFIYDVYRPIARKPALLSLLAPPDVYLWGLAPALPVSENIKLMNITEKYLTGYLSGFLQCFNP